MKSYKRLDSPSILAAIQKQTSALKVVEQRCETPYDDESTEKERQNVKKKVSMSILEQPG